MIRIRNFRPEDADTVAGFKRESAKVNFPGCEFNPKLFKRLILKSSKKCPDWVKVAEDDGKLIGYIWFKVIESTVGVFGRMEHLFVDERYRKRGVGRMLMESGEEYFRRHGIKKVKLTVTRGNKAVSLYEKMGYEVKRFKMEKDL
ncbi:MAG: GNAT family N-acetyltransferase [Candidatus Aenigmatarchaeota archaeon]|nr:MAG: GNAT family N-acetyltransferase [Candidatus Aenigmarchaeota archaeon]